MSCRFEKEEEEVEKEKKVIEEVSSKRFVCLWQSVRIEEQSKGRVGAAEER